MSYLQILIILVLVSVFLEWKYKIHLYKSRKERFLIPTVFFVIGVIWDWYATANGHWNFNFENLTGVRIGIIPLEEYLFILIVPYAILTAYRVLRRKV